jgi:hypothetical protein
VRQVAEAAQRALGEAREFDVVDGGQIERGIGARKGVGGGA